MQKKLHLEVLRVLAIILVLFHHTNYRGFMLFLERDGFIGNIYLVLSILCEIAVPIFFMISGGLLLKKDESIKKVLLNRVLKFVIILFLITVIYHFYDVYFNGEPLGNFGTIWNAFMTNTASGALWYLYSYIGLMLMLPFLRNLVKTTTKKQYIYLMILNLILLGAMPMLSFVMSNGMHYYTNMFSVVLATSMSIFYFLTGHFFENIVDKTFYNLKNCILLSIGACFALVLCVVLTRYRLDLGMGFVDSTTDGFHYTLIAIPTFSMYVWMKFIFYQIKERKWMTIIISQIGQCTFGIYLFERILRERTLFVFEYFDVTCPRIIACGIWICAMLLIGSAIFSLVKLIPGVKKFI